MSVGHTTLATTISNSFGISSFKKHLPPLATTRKKPKILNPNMRFHPSSPLSPRSQSCCLPTARVRPYLLQQAHLPRWGPTLWLRLHPLQPSPHQARRVPHPQHCHRRCRNWAQVHRRWGTPRSHLPLWCLTSTSHSPRITRICPSKELGRRENTEEYMPRPPSTSFQSAFHGLLEWLHATLVRVIRP
jgi:hypothetical protein